jgi:hypothetical protein
MPCSAAANSLALALAFALLCPGAASALDWQRVADVEEIEVLTTNEDGTPKETTIWLVVVDGTGFIRTSETSWWANIARDPNVTLRISGTEYPLRTQKIPSGELFDTVNDVFREKYGWSDAIISPFRRGEVKIMRMGPRDSDD